MMNKESQDIINEEAADDNDIERRNKLLHTIFHVCELAGFSLEGRITLKDKKTGKYWV